MNTLPRKAHGKCKIPAALADYETVVWGPSLLFWLRTSYVLKFSIERCNDRGCQYDNNKYWR
jgi:hypothetical protein